LNSRLPYAIVKNVGESFLKSYHREFGLNYTIFRFFNTYGPKQSTDFVVSKFIRAAQHEKEISIYGDGKQTRTFLFVEDNIEATINAFTQQKYLNSVVNIGHDEEINILKLAKTILSLTNSKSKIVHHPPLKEGDMLRRVPDNSKMKELLNRPFTSLEDGLSKTIGAAFY